MNKEELKANLNDGTLVVEVNNIQEGDFVVNYLKKVKLIHCTNLSPSQMNIEFNNTIFISAIYNNWSANYECPEDSDVIKFEAFKNIVESEDKDTADESIKQITINTKEELIVQLRNGNIGIEIENKEEGEYLINWMKRNGTIDPNDNDLNTNIDSGDIIGIIKNYDEYGKNKKYEWDFINAYDIKSTITFKRFKEIIDFKEDENGAKDNVGGVIGDSNWGRESINLELSEEPKIDPPINKTNNPFDLLNSRKTPLHLYSTEELEEELERRRNKKIKALENTINAAFEELISMGYEIYNVNSDANTDGKVSLSIEKEEVLIRGGKIKYE